MMTYEEVLEYLYSSLPMYQRVGSIAIKKDLTNTIALCNHLNNPHHQFKSIHIAGTNGKGSSAHSLAAVLQTAGYKTGLYTSPHLKAFTERIRVDGVEISKAAVVAFVTQHKEVLEQVKPSFFEMTVVMAFDYFAHQQVDVAIIEVGLGGRLDSTNVIRPLVSLITNIGYDHTDMLGESLAEIAFEKGGIIKSGVPAIVGEKQAETTPVFVELTAERNAPLYFAQAYYSAEMTSLGDGKFRANIYQGNEKIFENLPLALGGIYQMKNLPGILKTLDLLIEEGWAIEKEHIASGLAHVNDLTGLKGRWQILSAHPLVICDTGHNKEAFRDIAAQLKSMQFDHLHMVLGFSMDKDVDGVLRLLPVEAQYYFCQAQVPRAMDAHVLKEKGNSLRLRGAAFSSVEEALQKAHQKANSNDLIFIGGSTFVVAEVKEL